MTVVMAAGVTITEFPWTLDHSLRNALEIYSSVVPPTSAAPAFLKIV